MDLLKLVEKPTWRDLLIHLIEKENMDPWDIDIISLTNSFIEQIKKMKMVDLKIPANLLLAAAILLKFKSRELKFEEPVIEIEGEEMVVERTETGEYVLVTKQRFPPKRKITIEELVQAMEEAIKIENFGLCKVKEANVEEIIFKPENMDAKIDAVFERIKQNIDGDGMVMFTDLLQEQSPEEKVGVFVPIIYLAGESKIKIWQEELFGDLFVKLI